MEEDTGKFDTPPPIFFLILDNKNLNKQNKKIY